MAFSRSCIAVSVFMLVSLVSVSIAQQPQPRVRPPQARQQQGNGAAGQPVQRVAAPVGPPKGFATTPAETAKIDRMLDFWEKQTSAIKTFRTEFTRWQWDPVFGPKDQPKKITGGEIRYATPDKGMIKETKVATYNAKKKAAGEQWPFDMAPGTMGEHWVCDGNSVFEINHQTKQLIETKLPPDMRGKAIAEGPLPFMFGAKKDTIRARYWIREIPRKQATDPYHLEFVPKGRGANFSRVRVRLDAKAFMPTIMEVHELNNMGRSVYQFDNRKVNAVTDNVKAFWDVFVRPATPPGFQKIDIDARQVQQASRDTAPKK